MSNINKTFVVDDCDGPVDNCPIKANIIEACNSDNKIILSSGSTIFNKPIEIPSISSYEGNENIEGKFLSGTTSGFVLADISLIVPEIEDPIINEDIQSSLDIGGINQGDIIESGTTITEFVKKLITKTFYPTFVAPTYSITSSQTGLKEVNQVLNVTLTFNYNRGSILGNNVNSIWIPSAIQDFRSGVATSYNISGVNQASNIRTINNYTIMLGIQTFMGRVDFAAGPQPIDSAGNAYMSPLASGSSPTQNVSIEGVYPLFASSSLITVSTKQNLVSMISGNNVQINLVAETDGNKQFFEIPDAWLQNRPLNSVQFFNTVSNQFDNTNKMNTFSQSSITEIVQGLSIGYTRYTNNDLNRGTLLIRLIF